MHRSGFVGAIGSRSFPNYSFGGFADMRNRGGHTALLLLASWVVLPELVHTMEMKKIPTVSRPSSGVWVDRLHADPKELKIEYRTRRHAPLQFTIASRHARLEYSEPESFQALEKEIALKFAMVSGVVESYATVAGDVPTPRISALRSCIYCLGIPQAPMLDTMWP